MLVVPLEFIATVKLKFLEITCFWESVFTVVKKMNIDLRNFRSMNSKE